MGRVAAGRAFSVKLFARFIQMGFVDKSIPDGSRPGLPTTASGVAPQGVCGNYVTAGISEKNRRRRGGR